MTHPGHTANPRVHGVTSTVLPKVLQMSMGQFPEEETQQNGGTAPRQDRVGMEL